MVIKRRDRNTRKVDTATAVEIRRRALAGERHADLATEFGISAGHVTYLRHYALSSEAGSRDGSSFKDRRAEHIDHHSHGISNLRGRSRLVILLLAGGNKTASGIASSWPSLNDDMAHGARSDA